MTALTVDLVKHTVLNLLGEDATEGIAADNTVSPPVSATFTSGTTTTAEFLTEGINAALTAISTRVWKPSMFALNGPGHTFDLPDDFIDIEGVFDAQAHKMIQGLVFQPPLDMDDTMDRTHNAWYLYPAQQISFLIDLSEPAATSSNIPPVSGVQVYYAGMWISAPADDDTFELDIPYKYLTCLALYACSYLMLQKANTSGSIRQFNTKVDSGVPTNNVELDMSNAYLKRYESEMGRFPLMEHGIVYRAR